MAAKDSKIEGENVVVGIAEIVTAEVVLKEETGIKVELGKVAVVVAAVVVGDLREIGKAKVVVVIGIRIMVVKVNGIIAVKEDTANNKIMEIIRTGIIRTSIRTGSDR